MVIAGRVFSPARFSRSVFEGWGVTATAISFAPVTFFVLVSAVLAVVAVVSLPGVL
jgi:hypothetical protein